MIDFMAAWTPADIALLALKATLVLAGSWLLAAAVRRRSAAERHFVWLLGMGGLLALPVLSAIPWRWDLQLPILAELAPAGGQVESPPPASAPALASEPVSSPSLSLEGVTTAVLEPADDLTGVVTPLHFDAVPAAGSSGGDPATTAAAVALVAAGNPSRDSAVGMADSRLPTLLLILWLAGFLSVAVRIVSGHARSYARLRRARPVSDATLIAICRDVELQLEARTVRLRMGAPDEMPKTAGLFRPSLVLPPEFVSWPVGRQEAVIRHEIAHVRRYDTLCEAIVGLTCAIYWFHPLVWISAARLRMEREHACDDIVLLSGTAPSDYAADLLVIARQMRAAGHPAVATASMAKPSRLRVRLAAVLEDRPRLVGLRDARTLPLAVVGVAALLAVGVASPGGAVQPLPLDVVSTGSDSPAYRITSDAEFSLPEAPLPAVLPASVEAPASTDQPSVELAEEESPLVMASETIAPSEPVWFDDQQAKFFTLDEWNGIEPSDRFVPVLDAAGMRSRTVSDFVTAPLSITYRVVARLSPTAGVAPQLPAQIVASVRENAFLRRMNVEWGGAPGQAERLSAEFSFPDRASFESWSGTAEGKAFHAAVSDAAVPGSARFELDEGVVH